MTTTIKPNDVDFGAVAGLVELIQNDPEKAKTRWTAEVNWKRGFRTEARSRDFACVAYDEPPALGGSNTAPNPVEQVLGAYGSCLAIGYAANACAQGIEIKDLRIELEGDLDLHTFLGLADGNAGFSSIRAKVHLEADAEPEVIEALHQQVVATSPVGHTISRPVPVAVELA
ncbi:MAG TPA: OsmC family protein [Acidimicrobiia bacterium]|nr:OsmC family protein [Acidimicrobiia bacterium]